MTLSCVSQDVRWLTHAMPEPLPSVMSWTSDDPIAIRIRFGDDESGTIDWYFARDLMANVALGEQEESGSGDVCVSTDRFGGTDYLVVTLSVSHVLILKTEMGPILNFLENTFAHAPLGKEDVDVDFALSWIFGGGRPSGV